MPNFFISWTIGYELCDKCRLLRSRSRSTHHKLASGKRQQWLSQYSTHIYKERHEQWNKQQQEDNTCHCTTTASSWSIFFVERIISSYCIKPGHQPKRDAFWRTRRRLHLFWRAIPTIHQSAAIPWEKPCCCWRRRKASHGLDLQTRYNFICMCLFRFMIFWC